MTGGYLELQINGWIIGPIIAFRKYIFSDVLTAFGNIDQRAEEVANEYYHRIGAQPAGEYENFDMADVAEAAQQRSQDWYQMMVSLRQSMLNLLAAGLFHLTEQQLSMVCRDGGFIAKPPRDTKLDVVKNWYAEHLRLDLAALPSWGDDRRAAARRQCCETR